MTECSQTLVVCLYNEKQGIWVVSEHLPSGAFQGPSFLVHILIKILPSLAQSSPWLPLPLPSPRHQVPSLEAPTGLEGARSLVLFSPSSGGQKSEVEVLGRTPSEGSAGGGFLAPSSFWGPGCTRPEAPATPVSACAPHS